MIPSNFYSYTFWPSLFMMSKTFKNSENNKHAFRCLVHSSCKIINSTKTRKILNFSTKIKPINNYLSENKLFDWVYDAYVYVEDHPLSYKEINQKYNDFSKADWGPVVWRLIHTLAANYPFQYDVNMSVCYKAFITCLIFILPCSMCRNHLKENLAEFPIDDYLKTRDYIFLWTYYLHNRVNRQTGANIVTYDFARKLYGL